MTIDDIIIEKAIEVVKTTEQVLEDIKDMFSYALNSTKRVLASGTLLVSLMTLTSSPDSLVIDNQTPSLRIDIPRTPVEPVLALAEKTKAQIRLENKLDELRKLNDGWDGENAMKPNKAAIRQAAMLIAHLDDKVLQRCALFPSNDSGLFLQGKLAKGRLSVFMNGEMMAYVVKGNSNNKLSATVEQNAETISYLNQGLMMYV